MLLIECPWCGPRAESEFTCGGEADIARPLNPDALNDREWGDYLFMRKNPRGVHREQWLHTQGCRRWFVAMRDTVSYRIEGYEKVGQYRDQSGDQHGDQQHSNPRASEGKAS